MRDTGKFQQRTLAWAASLALVISVVLVGFAPTASAKVEHCPDGGEKYEVSGSGGTTTMTIDGRTVKVVVSGANVTFTGADDKPLNVEYCLKAGTDNTGKQSGTSGDTTSIPNNGGQTPAISYVKVYKVNTPPYVVKTETAQQQIEGQPNCETGTVAVYDQERTRTETSEGVWGAWTEWATVGETTRQATAQECPPYVLGTEKQLRTVEGQPNCETGTVAVYDQQRTRGETTEGVWGAWTEWATVGETTRQATAQECPPYVLKTDREQIEGQAQLRDRHRRGLRPTAHPHRDQRRRLGRVDRMGHRRGDHPPGHRQECPPYVLKSKTAQQQIEGQPNCETGTVAVYDQQRTRTETSEGVWGAWTEWATVGETTRQATAQECPPYVLGTEKQLRTVEGQPNCETGTVAVYDQQRTRGETSEGVWGAWTEWATVGETTRQATAQECPTEGPKTPGVLGKEKATGTPQVLGIQAVAPAPAPAPAAVPTAVDAGLAAQQGTSSTPWLLAGAALLLIGLGLGVAPVSVRGKRSR